MKSKNISIVLNDLQSQINQITAHSGNYQLQIEEVQSLINQREGGLASCVFGFEHFLGEYEKDHPRNPEWHKTLNTAKRYLLRSEKDET